MRAETIYYAFDETVFYDYDACLQYETRYYNFAKEIAANYTFYMNDEPIVVDAMDIETLLGNIDWALQVYTAVKVGKKISAAACEFLHDEFGFDLPTEPGLYKYEFGIDEGFKRLD